MANELTKKTPDLQHYIDTDCHKTANLYKWVHMCLQAKHQSKVGIRKGIVFDVTCLSPFLVLVFLNTFLIRCRYTGWVE